MKWWWLYMILLKKQMINRNFHRKHCPLRGKACKFASFMKQKLSTRSFVQLLILLVSVVMFAGSCANIVPPSGGDRDSLPPRLVMALPKDSAVNVKTKNITLSFDEFVELTMFRKILFILPYLSLYPLLITN